VTALFRRNTADVTATKTVLLNAQSTVESATDNNNYTYYNSLAEADAIYEVDNGTEEDATKRKAVLSGDILTYRVRLQNAGFFESDKVCVYDTVPEGCTYIEGSSKIYSQNLRDITYSADQYSALQLVAAENETSESGFTATVSGNELTWTIPTIACDEEYYVEYQVKVGDLPADQINKILENTATWSFMNINGDTNTDFEAKSQAELRESEIVSMDMQVVEGTTTEDENGQQLEKRKYTVDFQKNKKLADEETITYEDISFEYEVPENGFTLTDSNYQALTNQALQDVITLYDCTGTERTAIEWSSGEEQDGEESSGITITAISDTDGNIMKFAIKGLSLNNDTHYQVELYGIQQMLSVEGIQEIKQRASVTYKRINSTAAKDKTDESGNTDETENIGEIESTDETENTGKTENTSETENSGTTEKTESKGNSISKVERITNRVTTDETHLYLNIEKEIPVSDPSQTFLFKVERFDSQKDAEDGTEPTSVFYTTINCTNAIVKTDTAVTDTTGTVAADASSSTTTDGGAGNAASNIIGAAADGAATAQESTTATTAATAQEPTTATTAATAQDSTTTTTTTVYTGSRLIQVDERGYYRITEVTDWSATDYDFGEVSSSDVSTENYPSKALWFGGKKQTLLLAPLQGTITIQTVGEEKAQLPVAEFTLPRMMYEASQAFPTSMGSLADDTYPTVHFVDTESIYAYLSAQAYAQNTFNIFKDSTASAGTENTQPQENNGEEQQ
jgi:uncharacterized repeat protein (TIGR01451 family)